MRNYPHGGTWRGDWRGGYGEHHRGESDFMQELSDWAYGRKPIPEEFKAVVCAVMKHQTDRMLEQYGYTQQDGKGDLHHHYKEVLEELREVPTLVEAEKKFPHFFADLTPEESKVLKHLVNRPSIKKLAQLSGMSPERFVEIKHSLQNKLK